MAISQNTALFSLLGVQYGGDGKVTFGLPNLNGSVPMGAGAGPGLTTRYVGESGGSAVVRVDTTEMPAHTHTPSAYPGNGTTNNPTNGVWAQYNTTTRPPTQTKLYGPADNTAIMSPMALNVAGGGAAHNNMQPYLVLNYIIATEGIFPQRP
jgi:microcystin-dependent protein